jgi:site-specific recombinase XerD
MMLVPDVPKNLALPYVKRYRDTSGRLRHYFRKRRHKSVPLPGVPGSADFMAAYQDALGEQAPKTGPRQGPGTVGALIVDYLKSPGFANLKPSSQRSYRIVVDRFGELHGHRMVHDMPRAKVAAYIYAIGEKTPGMANLTKWVLGALLSHAVRNGHRDDNPVTQIESYKGGERHTWTESELAGYEGRWPLGTRERLAYELLLRTGQRGGDVVKMHRADISDGRIFVAQQKTGAKVSIPISNELAAALKAGPANGLHLMGGPDGRPITRSALTSLIKRAVAAAGLPPECKPHGLRKASLRRLAEAGATAKEIASISGHKSLREIERYTAAADLAECVRKAKR